MKWWHAERKTLAQVSFMIFFKREHVSLFACYPQSLQEKAKESKKVWRWRKADRNSGTLTATSTSAASSSPEQDVTSTKFSYAHFLPCGPLRHIAGPRASMSPMGTGVGDRPDCVSMQPLFLAEHQCCRQPCGIGDCPLQGMSASCPWGDSVEEIPAPRKRFDMAWHNH